MKKLLSTNTMILLTTMLLSFFVMELIMRGFLPEDMSTSWRLRVPHPEIGWSLQPDVTYHYRMRTDLVPVQHNSKGFHDEEHSYGNPAGIPRIVVLGDSFMEAFSVRSEETFYSQLASRLQEIGRPVEVINLGVGGYGTLQEYLVYMAEGRRYRPDVVVLGFYLGNDLRNNSRELEVIMNDGTMKVVSRPFLDTSRTDEFAVTNTDYEGAMQLYNAGLQEKDTLLQRLAGHLAIFRALEMVKTRLFPERVQTSSIGQEQKDFVALGMHFCEEPPAFTRAWENTSRILKQLNVAVHASGAELVIFTVPAEHEVDPSLMRSLAADFYDPDALCLHKVPAYERLRDISDELGINYIDLLPGLRQGALAGEKLFLADRHWNPASHAIAASQVAEILLEQTSIGH